MYLNTYLVENGIIVMKGAKEGRGRPSGQRVREGILDRRRVERLLQRLRLGWLIPRIPKRIRKILPTYSFETVDWSRTKAYFSSQSAQSVTVNLRGREPEGWVEPGDEYEAVVDEVVRLLDRLRDPDTRESPLAAVHRREDLFDGPYTENGPDIVLVPAEGYMGFKDFKDDIFEDVGRGWHDRSSEHERQGILIMRGPGIGRETELPETHLADIAPTVLHLCGVAVPRYMEGRVIEEAFEEDWLSEHPVRLAGPDSIEEMEVEGTRMSVEDEEVLKERLRGLGYLG
jgi:predicted AlkP superfamily phosphohydrolase/phosphomutase